MRFKIKWRYGQSFRKLKGEMIVEARDSSKAIEKAKLELLAANPRFKSKNITIEKCQPVVLTEGFSAHE